jgi:peptidyl-prolyl cis-trans isomerase C
MFKRIMLTLLALLLAMPAALGVSEESSETARLEARIAELVQENAELRALLAEEDSARLLAARFNGGVITVEEAKAEYEYRAYVYSSMGMDEREYEDIIKEEVLNDLTEDAVLRLKAQELGVYEPGEAEEAEIAENARQSLDGMIDYYLPFLADPTKSEAENRAAVEAYLATEDTTLQSLIDSATAQAWRDRLFARATEDLVLGDEELRRYYDEACSSAQLTYTTDPGSYEADRMNGEPVLWNMEGYRRVKRILVALDAEGAERMAELSKQLGETTDEAQVSALLAEMDALYTELDPIVQEIRTRIEAGDDFNLLIDEYGDDPFIQTGHGREEGYYVSASSTMLDEEFVLEAMALEKPGDISGPIECADGVYILRYEADVAPGPVSYEEFLANDQMRARVEESARNDYYFEQVDKWLAEAEIERFPENF